MLDLDLALIREQQVQKLLELGCHELLGMNEDDYQNSRPQIEDDSHAVIRGYMPLLVETIPLVELLQIARIEAVDFDLQSVANRHMQDRTSSYFAWVKIPYWKGENPDELAWRYKHGWQEPNTRVANLTEAVNYLIQYPRRFAYDSLGMNILGTRVSGDQYPYIVRQHNEPPSYTLYESSALKALRWGADVLMCYEEGKRIGPTEAQDGSKYGFSTR